MRTESFRRAAMGLAMLPLFVTNGQLGHAQTGCPLEPGDAMDLRGIRTVYVVAYASEDERIEFKAKLRRMHLRVVDDHDRADVVLMLAVVVATTIGQPADPDRSAPESEAPRDGDKTIAIVRLTGTCNDRLVFRKRIPAEQAAGALSELLDTFTELYNHANGRARLP